MADWSIVNKDTIDYQIGYIDGYNKGYEEGHCEGYSKAQRHKDKIRIENIRRFKKNEID